MNTLLLFKCQIERNLSFNVVELLFLLAVCWFDVEVLKRQHILRSVATVKARVGSLVLILRKYSNTNLTIISIPHCSSMICSIYTPVLNKL